MKKLLIIVVCLLLISGCYDYRELNDMSVVDGIYIDYEDNKYNVRLEIVKSNKGKDGNEIKNEILSGKDKSISKAFNKAIGKSVKEVYLGHVSLLVVSNNLASNGIDDLIDYVLRDINISNDYMILVSDGNNIFDIKADNESISQRIVSFANVKLGNNNVTVDMVGNKLLNKNIELVIPYLEVKDDKFILSKVSYFKDDKLDGIMDDKLYNFFMLDNISTEFSYKGNVISIYDKDIKYDVREDGINISIEALGKVLEIDKKYNLDKVSNYDKLEDKIIDVMEDELNKFIKDNKDIIGFDDMYYKKFNKNKDIDNYELDVSLKINKNGAIYEVLDD
jgi:spore germination protein KC